MQRTNKHDMMLEIWLPFKSNNADGKRIIAHQLRLALPPSGRGSIRYPPEEAGHPDRRTEAQVGTRSPVNPKSPRHVVLHVTPRDVSTIFRVREHPDWSTRLGTWSMDSSGSCAYASF
ncbi:hypothetical protein AO1008_00114 [Aspergillus oryzae 100-8]|nr:hypothetical protein Ao3042_04809 [Aspergillus oryzae 3.042]KDE84885.1 hypothetical protein AO1008_00114 [Aspergillus oryzae 100-8]|eukprot:EIT78928.1 hypothetical protein Ao3042_04809 [Aspergillus oryzae 3.042]